MAGQAMTGKDNGVNIEALGAAVKAIQEEPELGKCKFRLHNKWINGGLNHSKIASFYGLGQEMLHKRPFTLDADEPEVVGGNDDWANPVEHLLHALAACVTTSMVAHAAVRGIEIKAVESELEGELDIRGFLGLSTDVRKGYKNIRIRFKVDAAPEDIEKLKALARFSPVLDVISHGTDVDLQIEHK
jgi:uncharacterized OsmC-like protein